MESIEADTYLWDDGSIFSSTEITTEGWHWLEVTDENCGQGRDSIFLTWKDCSCEVVFPNAFSPNGDQVNDTFEPVLADCDYEIYDLKIYSRWGEVVFAANDKQLGWDGFFKGKKATTGVYIFCLNYQTMEDIDLRQKVGDISLMW